MTEPTPQQIAAAYWALPQEVRSFLYAEENVSRIEQMGKKFTLHDDQTSKLAKLSGEVIMGVTHLDAFAGEIRQRLNVDMIKAYDIAKEVSLEIFSKVTPWMEKIHAGEKLAAPEKSPVAKPPAATPPPKGEIPSPQKSQIPSIKSRIMTAVPMPKPEPKPEIPSQPLAETKEALIQRPPQQATSDRKQETSPTDTYREPVPPEDLPIVEENRPSPNIVDLRNKETQ